MRSGGAGWYKGLSGKISKTKKSDKLKGAMSRSFLLFERGSMFSRSERVVYPGHGVAQINRIIEKNIAGNIVLFFELKFLNKDMIILVPVDNASSVGIRKLSSDDHIESIFKMLAEPAKNNLVHNMSVSNWNKRNKEYQIKLRTGNLDKICEIYRDIKHIEIQKELSFGERVLLQQTEALLVEEIALVKKMIENEALEYLRGLVTNMQPPMVRTELARHL